MRKKQLLQSLLVAAGLFVGASASADDWSTVWSADFSSAPSGMTYSVSNGSVDISTGVLSYYQGGGSGNRAINTAFTADAFKVDTNWQMTFDWGAASANQNPSEVTFATNSGNAFTITWASYASTATITDANGTELTAALPIDGYKKATPTDLSQVVITGDTDNGIYLTVTYGETTYVDNVLVSSTYGYPATFNGSLGRAVSYMALDNIIFQIPAVAGFVPAPTHTMTGADGTSRKFTLSCADMDASIYYSETELEADASGWTAYTGEVTTDAETIYAIAKKGSDVSDVYSFKTGAGTEISLNVPSVFVAEMAANGDVYNATFNASYNAAGVEFTPAATLTATFTPNGGSAISVELPYTVTENGKLTVVASADGYASTEASIDVTGQYTLSWQSIDFSTIADEDAAETLGEGWGKLEDTGRWASWSADFAPYTYYQYTEEGVSVPNVTVDDKLRMRNVVVLNVGYGLGRNVTGQEAVSVLNTKAGELVAFKMYNGYGKTPVSDYTYYAYSMNNGSNPSVGTNNANVLVQATIYSPVVTEVVATISDYGYTTFASAYPIDVTDIDAYYASAVNESSVTLTKAEGTVKAGTGLVLVGDPGDLIIPVAESGDAIDGNLLVGCLKATELAANSADCYVLSFNDADEVEFQSLAEWGEAVTVPAGHAYLKVEAAEGRLAIVFDNTTTGINDVQRSTVNVQLYNLQGQRVEKAVKGLYIVNGKKVLK